MKAGGGESIEGKGGPSGETGVNTGRFYGKYRGVVVSNDDPSMLGRIEVSVPEVYGEGRSAWATPCAPPDGGRLGSLAVPNEGTGVWVEFERGQLDSPIWSGVWWSSAAEAPPPVASPYATVTLRTELGHTLTLDDAPGVGGITLETPQGQRIEIRDSGIHMSNGKGATITLTGPTVSVNEGALEVT